MTAPIRLGIDLGGTKTELRALERDGREAIDPIRLPTPRDDYDGTIATIVELAERGRAALSMPERSPVGVAIPGSEDPLTGLIRNANSVWLTGRPLRLDLERRLAAPVRLANDADCLAVSEATDGAAAGAALTFAVILGTGVGGGVAIGPRHWTGPNALAGEWGHNRLPGRALLDPVARACYCGQYDCIETYLCGPRLVGDFNIAGGTAGSVQEIAAARAAGDLRALRLFDSWFERVAAALAGVINTLDPAAIVFGGGLSNTPDLVAQVSRRAEPYVFRHGATAGPLRTRLARSRWGDSSGARGACRLWDDVSN